jgi:hypothetical protein
MLLVLALAGCTESPDSIALEYRNTLNEGIDAMMMATSDARAGYMISRVIKPMGDRFRATDRKLLIYETNSPTMKDFATAMMDSDGVHIYLTEMYYNRERLSMEITRIRNLIRQHVEREAELTGQSADDINPQQVCPKLVEIVSDTVIGPMRDHMKNPPLLEKLTGLRSNEKKIGNYADLYEKFLKKRKIFGPRSEIVLVE